MNMQSFDDMTSDAMAISGLCTNLYLFNTKAAMRNINNVLTIYSDRLFFQFKSLQLFPVLRTCMYFCEILHQISFNLELKIVYFSCCWSCFCCHRVLSVHIVVSLARVIIYKVGS